MAELDPIRVRFMADVGQFQTGVRNVSQQVSQFSSIAGPQAARHLKVFEGSLRALAFQAAGLPGPLGRITGELLRWSAGGPIALGVIAGLTAVATVWRAVKKATDEAREAAKKAADALQSTVRQGFSSAAGGVVKLTDALKDTQEQLDTMRERILNVTNAGRVLLGGLPRWVEAAKLTPEALEAMQQTEQSLERQQTLLRGLIDLQRQATMEQDQLQKAQGAMQDAVAAQLQRVTAAERNLADVRTMIGGATEEQLRVALERLSHEERALINVQAALKAVGLNDPHAQLIQGAEHARDLFAQEEAALRRMVDVLEEARPELVPTVRDIGVPGLRGPGPKGQGAEMAKEDISHAMADLFTDSEAALQEQLNAIGRSAMESLVAGFIEGTRDFEDLLKRVMIDFAVSAILGPFTKMLGIFSPSHVAAGWGRQIGAGLELGLAQARPGVGASMTALAAGPARMGLDVDWSGFPAAATPFDVARDATWQRVLRESMLVAKSHGFRA